MESISAEIRATATGVSSTTSFHYPHIPIDLEEGLTYVITAWDTNIFIKGLGGREFETTEQYGPELEDGREYLLISTKY